jgi:hypothetical protein
VRGEERIKGMREGCGNASTLAIYSGFIDLDKKTGAKTIRGYRELSRSVKARGAPEGAPFCLWTKFYRVWKGEGT